MTGRYRFVEPRRSPLAIATGVLSLALASVLGVSASFAQPCEVPDNGGGTVDLPPAGCGYVSPQDLHVMIDGLPAGTQINVSAEHAQFFNVTRTPGGNLGGEVETFDSTLFLDMQGTGSLAGFSRFIPMTVSCEVHTGPRLLGDSQQFPNEMVSLSGQILGDPDFDLLRIQAGSSFGLTSPGETKLQLLPNGNFQVDSFFDIVYTIEFQGASGSVLQDMNGTTQSTVRMRSGDPIVPPCTVVDNGSGTINLPPPGCGYVSPSDLHVMIDQTDPGTTLQIAPAHDRFFNVQTTPGGTLGGNVETFDSFLHLDMVGTGALTGFRKEIQLPIVCETHTGPRTPGAPVQQFPTEMFSLQGEIFGDPDFDVLRVTAGKGNGMPSPGHTTLTRLGPPGSDFQVDSFFDITYQIDFQGAPGGVLDGFEGSTQATVRMQSGNPTTFQNPCDVVDNGTGTVDLPPAGCEYLSPNEVHMIIDGLPPGTTINLGAAHGGFFNVQTQPLPDGGEREFFDSVLQLQIVGTGDLEGYNRFLQLPIQCQTATGPRDRGRPVQDFPTLMENLHGLVKGDQDFEFLSIQGQGPGHTTLTQSPGSALQPTYHVDSFFDIDYQIDFQGAPGGPLAGTGGTSQGEVKMATGNTAVGIHPLAVPNVTRLLAPRPNPFNPSTRIPFVLDAGAAVALHVYDVNGRLVRTLVDGAPFGPGRHDISWDGRDDDGRLLATGAYFYELRVDGVVVDTRKATLLK